MLTLVFLVAAIAGVVALLRRVGTTRAGRLAAAAVRQVRILAKAHRLRDLQEEMLQVAMDHRVPGLRRDFLPNALVFGWHPDDVTRWATLAGPVATEVAEILASQARGRGFLVAGEITVEIVPDPLARAGRPTLKARTRQDAHVVPRDRVAFSTVPITAPADESRQPVPAPAAADESRQPVPAPAAADESRQPVPAPAAALGTSGAPRDPAPDQPVPAAPSGAFAWPRDHEDPGQARVSASIAPRRDAGPRPTSGAPVVHLTAVPARAHATSARSALGAISTVAHPRPSGETETVADATMPVEPARRRQLAVGGPDGERVLLVDGLTVGRGNTAGLRLAGPTVSKAHARFRVSGMAASVEDLGSANGTFVNGRRIGTETPVRTGDVVAFGCAANRVQLVAG